jgi:osmoprotectant transport system substrate-binding protein
MTGRRMLVPLVALVVVSCGRASLPTAATTPEALLDNAITIGSFNFPESVVLAEIYAEALEAKGYRVIRQFEIGAREIVEPALERGLVELVPEYAGSALDFLGAAGAPRVGGVTPAEASDPNIVHDALVRAFASRGVTVLAASPAQDQNGFAVTAQTASTYNLRSVSDLGATAGNLTFGGPLECPKRPLCLLGLERTYGLHFKQFLPLDTSGPVSAEALRTGTVDVALMFTTDGDIQKNGFVLLLDDRQLQPAENVTPVVNAEIVTRFGQGIVDLIDEVSSRLTTDELRSLNAQLSDGLSASEVAAAWLATHGPG